MVGGTVVAGTVVGGEAVVGVVDVLVGDVLGLSVLTDTSAADVVVSALLGGPGSLGPEAPSDPHPASAIAPTARIAASARHPRRSPRRHIQPLNAVHA